MENKIYFDKSIIYNMKSDSPVSFSSSALVISTSFDIGIPPNFGDLRFLSNVCLHLSRRNVLDVESVSTGVSSVVMESGFRNCRSESIIVSVEFVDNTRSIHSREHVIPNRRSRTRSRSLIRERNQILCGDILFYLPFFSCDD